MPLPLIGIKAPYVVEVEAWKPVGPSLRLGMSAIGAKQTRPLLTRSGRT